MGNSRFTGPLLVALAAALWGTDSLYRFPTSVALDPTFIVFCEHLVGIVVLLPWIWLKHRQDLFNLGAKEWFAAFFVGAGGSAIATVLFTASFRYVNPFVTVVLQKIQPLFVVALAFLILGERPQKKFYGWALLAIAAGFVLSFPDLDVSFMFEKGNLHAKGVFYALGAAALWGASTVAGRVLLKRATPWVATFWRFGFGLGTLTALLLVARIPLNAETIMTTPVLTALAYLSIVTGVIPMIAYYAGMARTPATVVTIIELIYPVSAVIINTIFLNTPLEPIQIGAGAVLLFAITMISR